MPPQDTRTFVLPLDAFDASLLGQKRVDRNSPDFGEAVHQYFTEQFRGYGGWANIAVDQQQVTISWRPDSSRPDLIDLVIEQLEAGQYPRAIQMMELMLRSDPNDVSVLYNLGMALSDVGRLPEAETHLRRFLQLDPENINGRVALGVALQRQNKSDDAVVEFRRAVEEDPRNPWAHRNLGACLLNDNAADAKEHLRTATELNPSDQQAWYGLGKAYRALGDNEEADAAFIRTINLGERSPVAEAARQERSAIGHETFRERGGAAGRPDAVMYCLAALQKFHGMPIEKVRMVLAEIAMRGMNGFDVNNPTQKYEFKSLPGKYSGLSAVCHMFVAGKIVVPEHDLGFDVSAEYETAKSLHAAKGWKG